MESPARKQLKDRIFKEIDTMFTMGDRSYLLSLRFSRPSLLEVLEKELGFLGLYRHDDQETPGVIREILEKNLDQWINEYLTDTTSSKGTSEAVTIEHPFEPEYPLEHATI